MALRSKWTLRVDQLETKLRVGRGSATKPHAITVNLRISGLTETHPQAKDQCLDFEEICRWVVDDWPSTPATELLETRFNELVEHIFAVDRRVMSVWVGLYMSRAVPQAARVGLEREVTRRQYQEQLRDFPLAAGALRRAA